MILDWFASRLACPGNRRVIICIWCWLLTCPYIVIFVLIIILVIISTFIVVIFITIRIAGIDAL